MLGRKEARKPENVERILEVDASMQGSLTFKDPVNLRINGNFEGVLETKGTLAIGEKANVKASIKGETISIAGEVIGDVLAEKELKILTSGRLIGDVQTPLLSVESGAVLQGKVSMITPVTSSGRRGALMNADELATYLAVEKTLIFEWADSGKLPAIREGSSWRFDKAKVDEWVASGRIK